MDIIPDSQDMGRCYIPSCYLTDCEYKSLTEERNPYKVENQVLQRCVKKILKLYKNVQKESIDALELLPKEVQRICVLACIVLNRVAEAMENSPNYEPKVNVSKLGMFYTLLKALYFGSLDWLKTKPKPEKQHW